MKNPEALESKGISAGVLTERHAGQKWPIHYHWVEPFAILADIATIATSSLLASFLFCQLQDPAVGIDVSRSLGSAILVSALFISLMKIRGMYLPAELLVLTSQTRAVCLTWITVFFLLAGAVFALKIGGEISRGASTLFAALGLTGMVFQRRAIQLLLEKGLAEKRFSGRSIVLIAYESAQDHDGLIRSLMDTGFRVKRKFLLPAKHGELGQTLQVIKNVIGYVRDTDIEEIVVAADPERWAELRPITAELRIVPFPVSFVPLGAASEIFKRPHHRLGDAISFELQRGLLSSLEHVTKRGLDLAVAGTALLALLPLLVIVSLAIKVDSSGPVLFRQRRCGFNGKYFEIRKFRTMSVLEDGPTIVQAQQGDKRITRLGVWLRRTSIDELPQLLNVLDGSMSLVGPRPHAIAHDNEFDKIVEKYAFRRRMKPGLTGWAQVHGYRGATPTPASIERRVQYDLWYIDNWSLWLDIKILLQTPIELIRGRNAY